MKYDGWELNGRSVAWLPVGTACKDSDDNWSTCREVHGGIACGEQDRCWRRMPSGCDRVLGEPGSMGTGLPWFEDGSSHNEAKCTERIAAFHTHCNRADALTYW